MQELPIRILNLTHYFKMAFDFNDIEDSVEEAILPQVLIRRLDISKIVGRHRNFELTKDADKFWNCHLYRYSEPSIIDNNLLKIKNELLKNHWFKMYKDPYGRINRKADEPFEKKYPIFYAKYLEIINRDPYTQAITSATNTLTYILTNYHRGFYRDAFFTFIEDNIMEYADLDGKYLIMNY